MRFKHLFDHPAALPVLLAAGMIGVELLLLIIMLVLKPSGWTWLGDTIQNSSDVAVYLHHIGQGRIWLQNLYAVEPHAARFDLVWSTLSVIHGFTNIPPVVLHECARLFFTLFLAWIMARVAQRTFTQKADAYLGCALATGGVGFGWALSVWTGIRGQWTTETFPPFDLITEFAVAPSLIGGAHTILSIALLLYAMEGIWKSMEERSLSRTFKTAFAMLALTAFHPYFIPLCGVMLIGACVWQRTLPRIERIRAILVLGTALIPATIGYALLYQDPTFSQHHTIANALPLSPLRDWIVILFPLLLAALWMIHHRITLRDHLYRVRWCMLWVGTAIALAIFLPVPWSRKLLEGLMIPLVWITLPAWRAGLARLPTLGRRMAIGALILVTPLYLLSTQLAWASSPTERLIFYAPPSLMRAWNVIATKYPNSVVAADRLWIGVWTPAMTGTTAWFGHVHETPHVQEKRDLWNAIQRTEDVTDARKRLDNIPVRTIITTSSSTRMRIETMNPAWKTAFEDAGVSVLVHQ
jgi:hypothetical protein